MQKLYVGLLSAICCLIFYSCTDELEIRPDQRQEIEGSSFSKENQNFNTRISTTSTTYDVIDFEGLDAGTLISEIYSAGNIGPVGVMGNNPTFPGKNAAMIFDSSHPTGGDWGSGTPHEDFGGLGRGEGGAMGSPYENNTPLGNILILTEDFDSSDPDNCVRYGASFVFDFSAIGPVTVYGIHNLDVEEQEAATEVEFFDAEGNLIGSPFALPHTGDGGVVYYEFGSGVDQVMTMRVQINGSSAVDNIVFSVPEPPVQEGEGCTHTQGYWKNHTKYSAAGRDNIWDKILPAGEDSEFFLSEQTYLEVLNTAPKGNSYYQLAHQYIAARLNILSGAWASEEVKEAIKDTETWLGLMYTPDQIATLKGNDSLRKQIIATAELLDQYNNGHLGTPKCD